MDAIRRVALDAGSRTSAALTQILLASVIGVSAEVTSLPLDREAEDVDADAVLLIGDRAMRACLPGFQLRLRSRPGVVRLDGLAVRLRRVGGARRRRSARRGEALHQAKRARTWTVPDRSPTPKRRVWDWTPVSVAAICRNILHFDLGPREQAGLHHYYMLACELGLVRRGVNLEYYHCEHLAKSR